MAKVEIELNSEGVRELLRSPAILAACRDVANGVAARAGDGYSVSSYTGTNRVNVSVGTETAKAMRDNLKNNTLLKAVNA